MNRKTLATLLTTVGLTVGFFAAPAFALTEADEIGLSAVADSHYRTIHVDKNTRSINVESPETVNFDVNGMTTAWTFNGTARTVTLRRIVSEAPNVTVYVGHPQTSSD